MVFALFLITLNFAMLIRIAYITWGIYSNRSGHCQNIERWLPVIIGFSHVWFLTTACVINIYNWLIFAISLKSNARHTTFIYNNRNMVLNIIIPFVIFWISIYYIAIFTYNWVTQDKNDFLLIDGLLTWYNVISTGIFNKSNL